ncbi:unnamed protein product [Knipowitschia caucasica]
MDRRRRSKVWLYFSLKKDGLAQCNTCGKYISAKGGCTTNMKKHLRQLHGIQCGNECTVFDVMRRSPAPVASSTSDSEVQQSASNSALETESADSVERSQSDAASISQSAAAAALTGQRPRPVNRETPFTLAARGKLSAEQIAECHRKVTAYVVKRLHPLSDVESPTFR